MNRDLEPSSICETYTGKIYCGTRVAYTDEYVSGSVGRDICQAYCDKHGCCFTFDYTDFIYTGGTEVGFVVGIINYPRFPKEPFEIRDICVDIAKQLKKAFKQERVSIVFPDITVMIGEM